MTDELTIEAIFIADLPHSFPIKTSQFLNSLSDTEWTDIRTRATRSRDSPIPLLRCGDCKSPVYARESLSGRRHCYHFGTTTKDCRWFSANAKHLRSIDAEKFKGNQESDQHKRLKDIICEILSFDQSAANAGIVQERYTKGMNGDYTFPDVYAASWQGEETVFEIQLAATQLPTILRREQFYKFNSIRLCWIIDQEPERLRLRAFKDIYFRNDGQILGVDEDLLKEARQAAKPLFRLYRLLPDLSADGFKYRIKNRVVTIEEINWGGPGAIPKSANSCYDAYLNTLIKQDHGLNAIREQFYTALNEGKAKEAEVCWNLVAEKFGGQAWGKLGSSYDTISSLGVLATIRRGKLTVQTKIKQSELVNLINSKLLEPKGRRCWTHAFKLLALQTSPEILLVHSVAQKCERNLSASVDEVHADLAAGQVFNIFFPEGAFQRIKL